MFEFRQHIRLNRICQPPRTQLPSLRPSYHLFFHFEFILHHKSPYISFALKTLLHSSKKTAASLSLFNTREGKKENFFFFLCCETRALFSTSDSLKQRRPFELVARRLRKSFENLSVAQSCGEMLLGAASSRGKIQTFSNGRVPHGIFSNIFFFFQKKRIITRTLSILPEDSVEQ